MVELGAKVIGGVVNLEFMNAPQRMPSNWDTGKRVNGVLVWHKATFSAGPYNGAINNMPPIVTVDDTAGTVDYVYPMKSDAELMQIVRSKRDRLLQESDWTALTDIPLTAAQMGAWATYRNELRSLPQVYAGNAHNVIFPKVPK